MFNRLASLCAITALVMTGPTSSVAWGTPKRASPTGASAEGPRLLRRLPVGFVPNLGQWGHAARYVARVGTMTVFLEERGWTLTLVERAKESARGVAMRMTFAGADTPTLVAGAPLPGRHNYFLGGDPSRWRSDVPLYRTVCYRGVHSGVDVRAREHDGHFEYDLLLQPDADLAAVEIVVEGIERMRVDTDGALVFETQVGSVHMPVPRSWQVGPEGEEIPIACHYGLRGSNRFGFEAPDRQPDCALVVDPGLVWSTFLGGTGDDRAFGVAVDLTGATTVGGWTTSVDFPTTPGAFAENLTRGIDTFVTKLDPAGSSLEYSTYLGGQDWDQATALALDPQGGATVAGQTHSHDFPTTLGAFDRSHNGFLDAFVARLSPSGSSLVYSTLLGGASDDKLHALAVDDLGTPTVVGRTTSSDFPTTSGAFDPTFNGIADAFVTRLSATGSAMIYSTFLGAGAFDEASALALDTFGGTTVAGQTASRNFPTTAGALDRTHNGDADVFIARLSPTGAALTYSTFLGGTGVDYASGVALTPEGTLIVAGVTRSIDFPTTSGAFGRTHRGGSFNGDDVFVTCLSSSGTTLAYSTYLGGASDEQAFGLAIDGTGAATVVGQTESADFPTTAGAFDRSHNGYVDVFVTRLSPTGSSILYSTLFGGGGHDQAAAVAIDALGGSTVAVITGSPDLPTTAAAFDSSFNGTYDASAARFAMLPDGAFAFGRSSAGCTGALAISVTSMPRVGTPGFAITCGNAPPNAAGMLVLTADRFASPFVTLGVEVWVDPARVFVICPASSNHYGACALPLPIPDVPSLAGTYHFAQFFWAGSSWPSPCPPQGLSASNALAITIQP